MAKRNHVHKYYYGMTVGYTSVWACAIPGCTHYLPAHMESAIVNRFSLCWNCNDKFVLDGNKHIKKPMCGDCMELEIPSSKSTPNSTTANEIEDFQPTSTQKSSQPTQTEEFPMCSECQIVPPMKNGTMCYKCFVKINP